MRATRRRTRERRITSNNGVNDRFLMPMDQQEVFVATAVTKFLHFSDLSQCGWLWKFGQGENSTQSNLL